jgi:amicyanin
MPRLSIAVAALVGTLGVAHVGSPPGTPVDIRTFQFTPDTLRVSAGTTVTWTNQDEIEHTVTFGTPERRDPRVDGRLARKGSTYSATLEQAGTYQYFCDRHQFMRATILVR